MIVACFESLQALSEARSGAAAYLTLTLYHRLRMIKRLA